ncbi:tRNA (N(6)-L-threonylcarbamoyladenosine(37)-C(2))-methylthiotransferase MtaB [Candidatus Formimonas warabiya]|uniref:tRNA (N(6)-L-threonylcarbamoyladenosine(37)-C(2))- methylthiotransferase MtaB n=1 Tax=Formimonas warabiya TaxID=1761012 RepID=UPI001F016F49|nr:tRNA (N(6)-L-threonylcarbamoyladenosine(37)-C(2))-methylthiotransferase MtaB [Candidatus Formimonas warabiya]
MVKPKAAIYTLGCKVNQNESDAIISTLAHAGYEEVSFEDKADVYIINTCTVTHLADRKSRQMIRRAVKTNPRAVVAVTGCYAQTAPGEVLGISGVNLVIGTRDRHRLAELIEEAKEGRAPINAVRDIMDAQAFEEISQEEVLPHKSRAYLKIQEGCNQYCSYCIIPYARGPMRSRPVDRVIRRAEELVAGGYQEIILTGIHTGAYGVDLAGNVDLAFLVERLIRIEGLKRLRISSIDPHEIGERLLNVIAGSPVLCRHLHIPLQSGDDAVLQRMNRVYDTAQYAELIGGIRQRVPGIALTTDIMVGFPGETEEEFLHSYQFIERIDFSGLHVFKYSPRQGTPAATFPHQVAPEIKESWSNKLITLGRRLLKNYAEKHIGSVLDVLVEQHTRISGQAYWEGHTDNYLHVAFPSAQDVKGQLIDVRLETYRDGFIFGHPEQGAARGL